MTITIFDSLSSPRIRFAARLPSGRTLFDAFFPRVGLEGGYSRAFRLKLCDALRASKGHDFYSPTPFVYQA